MKLLHTIDSQILGFWQASPDDRLWAYIGLVPVATLIVYLVIVPFLP